MTIAKPYLFRPSGAGVRLTVSNSAVAFPDFGSEPTAVYIQVQDASVRISIDGVNPAPTGGPANGAIWAPGDDATWSMDTLRAAKFIRDGATNAVIQAYPLA